MDSFLVASKAALSNLTAYEKVRVVLGNESCDLDSAVSALVQGLSDYLDAVKGNERSSAIIPLMNVTEREYPVKTEVVYYLNRHDIAAKSLTFRDQVDLQSLMVEGNIDLEVVLVDHHTLPDGDGFLADRVVEVIDHRPRDARWPWPGRKIQLERVGSCATLVARNILRKHPEAVDPVLSNLLRGPILVDTCNFSKEADRATPLDLEILQTLERVGRLDPSDRSRVFDEIVEARADVSRLTVHQLLIKDLKIAGGVPIVGLPVLVENFLQQQRVFQALRDFAESRKTTVVVLIGLQTRWEKVTRDVGIYSLAADRLKQKIVEAITLSVQPSLDLSLAKDIEEDANGSGSGSGSGSFLLYRQGNLRATRKQILPIVRAAVSST